MYVHGVKVVPSRKGKPVAHAAHHAKMKFFGRHDVPKRATSPGERHAQLTEQTQKWVAQTFYGQMLKQMRDSPFKSKLFDGGRGGEAFQEMADQHLAESMASGTGHKLVDAIVDKIEHAGGRGACEQGVTALPASLPAAVNVNRFAAKVNLSAAARGRDLGHG